MTKARQEQVSLEDTPYYHCVVRCVRRAFLCGDDYVTGKNYDHRRQWMVDKLKELSSIFSIDICAYAIMSNHYHVVLHVDVDKVESWSAREVIERWQQLFAGNVLVNRYMSDCDMSEAELIAVNEIVEKWRKRLKDISWFMRCMNESVAREANKEDNCKGRFWEGRFKSQALLDETALLSCMMYVDLNPVRAGMADSLEDSDFTSIQERIRIFAEKENLKKRRKTSDTQTLVTECKESLYKNKTTKEIGQPKQLVSFVGNIVSNDSMDDSERNGIEFSPLDYFELIDWTGRAVREDKRGAIPDNIRPILQKLGVQEDNWLKSIEGVGSISLTATGAIERLKSLAQGFGKKWIKGTGICKQLYSC